jgi:undecaprenyl-diphosphatase
MTYLQAIVIGLLQGVTELFPVSSLGHSVLVPALLGGSWARNLDMSANGSPYLAFLVAVHVATAAALVIFFWRDWLRIIGGLVSSVRQRRIETPDQRLAWLLVVATIPVGLAGIALDHVVRTTLGRPIPAAVFLTLNGVVLYAVERLRARTSGRGAHAVSAATPATVGAHGGVAADHGVAAGGGFGARGGVAAHGGDAASDARLGRLGWGEAMAIGAAQILALLPGVSRSGSTIAAGLLRGLDHEDAARFAFLLATPVIAAAAVFKLPDLAGPAGRSVLGPVVAGSLVAGVAAYISLRWLTRYFQTHTLKPFAIYCAVAGIACFAWFTLA